MNNLKFKWPDSGIWVKRFHREDRKADRGEPNLQLDEDLIAKMETWFGDFSEQVKLQVGNFKGCSFYLPRSGKVMQKCRSNKKGTYGF